MLGSLTTECMAILAAGKREQSGSCPRSSYNNNPNISTSVRESPFATFHYTYHNFDYAVVEILIDGDIGQIPLS